VNLRVRQAVPADATALVELAQAVGSEPEGWLITDGDWRTVAEERRYLRAVRRSPHVAVLVAEAGQGIVGRLSIVRDTSPACEHVADVGLMVARAARCQGVGRALMLAAEDWARASGIRKIELHVFPHNEAARRLYQHLGYLQEGYRVRHFRRADGYVDAILMAKLLD
jgi:RimJ/RimL family protein N-acetyltransferase